MLRSLLLISLGAATAAAQVATFSIVAYDAAEGEWGVTVASRYFSVGSVGPLGRSRSGSDRDPG